jgi:hypothetical protein
MQAESEALELGYAALESIGRRDVDDVVDATVLLEHVDVVPHRHPVELCVEEGVHGFSAVEREDLLLLERPLGGAHDEVSGQRGQRRVIVGPATHVEERGGSVSFVAVREIAPLDVNPPPPFGDWAQLQYQAALAERAILELVCVRAPREAGEGDKSQAAHRASMHITRVSNRIDAAMRCVP